MTPEFGAVYSQAYDVLYKDKDYGAEVDLVEQAFERFASSPVKTVLDLGCGTGGHLMELERRGYRATGVDRSEHMISRARSKISNQTGVVVGDARTVKLGKQFDAALMMFAVLSYQLGNQDVAAALRTVRDHLEPKGLFVFDVWFGPAVLSQRPTERIRTISSEGKTIIRAARSSLDLLSHTCDVEYRVWGLEKDRVVEESSEVHRVRYFFPLELELHLEQAGLRLLSLSQFPTLDSVPTDQSWNVLGIAEKS